MKTTTNFRYNNYVLHIYTNFGKDLFRFQFPTFESDCMILTVSIVSIVPFTIVGVRVRVHLP